jgi:hypothetical protein
MAVAGRISSSRGLRLLPVLAMSLAGLSVGGRMAAAQQASVDTALASAKAALARYQDPTAAVYDGYFSTVSCIDYPTASGAPGMMAYKAGAMGVHFLNTALIGPTLDPTKPQVLIYEPNGDKLQLVGAEWFTPVMPDVKEAPKIFGRALEGPMEGHAPIMPNGLHHWDLHVWLWKRNPNGTFSPTNPDVKCPKTGYSYVGDPPKMVMP